MNPGGIKRHQNERLPRSNASRASILQRTVGQQGVTLCIVPLHSWPNGERYLAAAAISIFQMLEDIHKAVPHMCNVIAVTYWHNTATAVRNNQGMQIPYSKRHKPPPGVRLREKRGHPITFSRREIVLKVIFVAVDTRNLDGTNDPYYQQLRRAIFRGKLEPL